MGQGGGGLSGLTEDSGIKFYSTSTLELNFDFRLRKIDPGSDRSITNYLPITNYINFCTPNGISPMSNL